MLEEVQMTPGLRLAVMDRAAVLRALRAREPRALRKVDAQIKTALLERAVGHAPRSLEPERLLEEVDISHPYIVADAPAVRPGSCAAPRRQETPLRGSLTLGPVGLPLTARLRFADGGDQGCAARDRARTRRRHRRYPHDSARRPAFLALVRALPKSSTWSERASAAGRSPAHRCRGISSASSSRVSRSCTARCARVALISRAQ